MVVERVKLFNELVEYEQKHIINKEPYGTDEIEKPSPQDVYNMQNLYLKELTDLIVEKAKKSKLEDFMHKIADEYEQKELTDEEKEFENYSRLYEEKFGKKAYIAEPSGTMSQTICAIKTCLEKNEYLLDSLLYPDNNPTCPNCSKKLTFMMPDGKTLYCDNCKKYYANNNGVAGEETVTPYTRTDVFY